MDEYIKQKTQVEKLSHDDIACYYSKGIDKAIIHAVKEERLSFMGGKFYLVLSPDGEQFCNVWELYFRRPDGEWVKKTGQTVKIPLDRLILDSRNKLRRERKIEYEVTNPLEGQ